MFEEYANVTDEELIDRLRQGEDKITDYIMDKYKNLVRKKAKSMYILGADSDDLIQEGMIGLFKAVRDYDAGRDASFYTFADLCISRQMYTAVQASGREKHAPLNSYISLYADMGSEEGSDAQLVNVLTSGEETNPEALVIDRENVADIEAAIEQGLSDFEKQVLDLYLTGMSYSQIARVLGRDDKSTDNALQRLKSKLRKTMRKSRGFLILLSALLVPMRTCAEEEMTSVSLDEVSMEITVPSDCFILGQEIDEDEPYLEKVGGDREKIEDYYKEADIYLNAIAQDDSYEIVVTVNENDQVTYLYNMQSVLDEKIMELADSIQTTYEEYGYTVDDYTLYENENAKYIVFSFGQEYEDSAVQCKQYDTIRNSRMYNITLRSYTGEVTGDMDYMLQRIVDSIVYTDAQEALTYESTEYGVSYELAAGWQEITADADTQESDIQVQYMHSNGLGESIQFIARDVWGEMDMLHQLTNTRSELDGDSVLDRKQIEALYPYLSDFFAGADTVYQQQIGGEWYFVSDTPLTYESDKLQGTYLQRSIALLKKGVLCVWQYGYYEDGNLHEEDYEDLLESVTYHEPAVFQNDNAAYRSMVRVIPCIIFGIVALVVVSIALIILYKKGTIKKIS